ncbi:isopentenyl-diphosphate Delta-isomerase [bacterium]|nr:isopentenyl-diphosphate Delta-isomerase [bacterium]
MKMDDIILVNSKDEQIGTAEKMAAHKKAQLHRAFSIFVFNDQGQLMIQQRALDKYHCGGLWTNTTCSHPAPGEKVLEAAHKRLQEEMGFDCDLEDLFTFEYKVEFDNGLTEHEMDHALIGIYNDDPKPNPQEANDWKWIDPDELKRDLEINPEKYTYWFKEALDKVVEYYQNNLR